MRTFPHAVLPTAILIGLTFDLSLALHPPAIPHPSKTSVHNSSTIPQRLKSSVAATLTSAIYPPSRTSDFAVIDRIFLPPGVSPPPTDSVITAQSPSTASLPQNSHRNSDLPVPEPGPIGRAPDWRFFLLPPLVRPDTNYYEFFKKLYSRDAPPDDVKIIDRKGSQDVKIIDTKGSQDASAVSESNPEDDDILIIDRKGPNPIPNPPPPAPGPTYNIDDIRIIDRKGPNPTPNPNPLSKRFPDDNDPINPPPPKPPPKSPPSRRNPPPYQRKTKTSTYPQSSRPR